MRTKRPLFRATWAAAGLAVLLALSACGASEEAEKPQKVSQTEHNKADIAFATGMIQHHAQALEMVDLTMGRNLDPTVQRLADQIRAAQSPEIETMSGWLRDWGEEVPATMRDNANDGNDGGGGAESSMSDSMEGMGDDMPQMMSAEDMDALENASDAEFSDMWLKMMIEHHEGAIEMAETEQDEGRFKPAVDLAGTIIEAQTAEIDTMEKLLG